jgi:hypothetical protein
MPSRKLDLNLRSWLCHMPSARMSEKRKGRRSMRKAMVQRAIAVRPPAAAPGLRAERQGGTLPARSGRCRWWPECVIALLVAMFIPALVLGNPMTESPTDAGGYFHRGWSLSIDGGGLRHSGVARAILSEVQTDLALQCGVARSVGTKVVLEIGAGLSVPHGGMASPSSIQGKARLRWYPAATHPQRDQIFLQGGPTLIFAKDHAGGTRHGGGIEAAIGMDYFLAQHNSVFAEFGFGVVALSRGNTVNTGSGSDPSPPDRLPEPDDLGTLLHLVLGVRFGL